MNKTLMLAVRNVNLILLAITSIGLFTVDKRSCVYFGLEVIFGLNIIFQCTSIIWSPDLFLYFLSVFGMQDGRVPTWAELKLSKKVRLIVTMIIFLAFGVISVYAGFMKLRVNSCI
jgi:hypothetical protein